MPNLTLPARFLILLLSLVLSCGLAAAPAFTITGISNESVMENMPYMSTAPVVNGNVSGGITYSLVSSLDPYSDLSDLALFNGLNPIQIILMYADSLQFTIDSATGVVSMDAKDFEAPSDINHDNIYNVTIIATDDAGHRNSLSWNVTVLNQPSVTFTLAGISNKSIYENVNYNFPAPNINGSSVGPLNYSLTGNDAGFFTVNSTTGAVSFAKQDYETPLDTNADNHYEVTLVGTDTDGNTASLSWTVTVLDLPALSFSMSSVAESFHENAVYTSPAPVISGSFRGPLTYSLNGGIDDALFTVSSTGVVTLGPQNFATPIDANLDNVYEAIVTATDSDGNVANATITITITDTPTYDDSDGDGVLDTVEYAEGTNPYNASSYKDTDNDSIPDAVDADADNDGILNAEDNATYSPYATHSPYTDNDADGRPDYLDADDRGDGTPATCADTNADKICDSGYALDPWFDKDQDGKANHADFDSDNDFIPDAIETVADMDGDGTPDYLDFDSENDGIPDIVESGTSGSDSNYNGIADYFDAGITGGPDINKDGIDDNVHAVDSDNDGIANYLDKDSDNDSIPDVLEGTQSKDSDLDGIDDQFDINSSFGFDINKDGINDLWKLPDTDNDGIPDYLDIDSDNDGISDLIESGSSGLDANSNGIDDLFDAAISLVGIDSNGDGVIENNLRDSDADGVIDCHDLDSDNDSIPDVKEAYVSDIDQNALKDSDILATLPLPDADHDSIADYLETDSNNDGTFDIAATTFATFDTDNDGRVQLTTDVDLDGIDNSIDTAPTEFGLLSVAPPPDTDGDGVGDNVDPDIDGDGISNIVEGTGDNDNDGITNQYDLDSDNDGISDYVESGAPAHTGDTNHNGIDDSVDVLITAGADNNTDGIDDAFTPRDSDHDSMPDYLDADSDNDGWGDRLETSSFVLSGIDSNGNGVDNIFDVTLTGGFDLNNDGIADDLFTIIDTDNDGVPNYLDADSDNDNIGDASEGLVDSDLDGVLNRTDRDSDNDGISDYLESGTPTHIGDTNHNGIDDSIDVWITHGTDANHDGIDDAFAPRDNDNDGISDYLDTDSDNDTLSDVFETSGLVLTGTDSDLDGIDNVFDVDVTHGPDANLDGVDDAMVVLVDTDNDGKFNHVDTDSDNDGFLDQQENDDTNHNGIPDRLEPEGKVKASSGSGSSNGLLMLVLLVALLGRKQFLRKSVLLLPALMVFALPLHAEEEIVCRDYKSWPSNQNAFAPCFYAGIGLGFSSLDADTTDSSWKPLDDRDNALSLYGGYHFSHDWFVELMFADLGKTTLKSKHVLITAEESVSYQALSVFAGYYLPLDLLFKDNIPVKFFLKAGASQLSNDASSSLVHLDKDSQTVLASGIGIEWPFRKDWMLRGEMNTFSAEAKIYTVSVAYWFGGKKHYYELPKPQTTAEQAPAESVAASAPVDKQAPKLIPVPMPEVSVSIADSDADGVPDDVDKCVDTQHRRSANKEGCVVYTGVIQSLYGAFNSTDLTYPSFGALDTVIALLKSYPDTRIEIQAHTDSKGTTELNQKLSQQRAQVVKDYLVEKGIAAKRIDTKGFGETQPLASNDTMEGRSKNRRIDFKVLNK